MIEGYSGIRQNSKMGICELGNIDMPSNPKLTAMLKCTEFKRDYSRIN